MLDWSSLVKTIDEKNLVYNNFMAKNSRLLIDIGQGLSMMIGLPKIPFWDTASRPKNAKNGTFGFNTQTKRLEYWDGKAWWVAAMLES